MKKKTILYFFFFVALGICPRMLDAHEAEPTAVTDTLNLVTDSVQQSQAEAETRSAIPEHRHDYLDELNHNLFWIKDLHDEFHDFIYHPNATVLRQIFHTIQQKPLIIFFIALIFVFLANVFFIIVSMFITLLAKNGRQRVNNILTVGLEERLTGFLFDDTTDTEQWYADMTLTKLQKHLLVDILYTYQLNITGEYLSKVFEIYDRLRLYRYSGGKLKSGGVARKVTGIRELVCLYPSGARQFLLPYIANDDAVVRSEVQIGLAMLDDRAEMLFLGQIEKSFSRWSQLNVVAAWQIRGAELPSLAPWLSSPVRDLQIFAIRGITYVRQTENVSFLLPLLDCDDEEVRFYIYEAFIEFSYSEAKQKARDCYEGESCRNQSLIIRFLGMLDGFTDFNFFETVLRQENFQLRMDVCQALLNKGKTGADFFKTMNKSLDSELTPYFNHIQENNGQ